MAPLIELGAINLFSRPLYPIHTILFCSAGLRGYASVATPLQREMAMHIHNSDCLTFQPHDPAPGFASLHVWVCRSETIVSSRSGYWFSAEGETNSEAEPQ